MYKHTYGCAVSDPAWNYSNRITQRASGKRTVFGEGTCYDTRETSEMETYPVGDLFAQDAALGIWTTFPFYEDAPRLARAWGFEFSTISHVWLKVYDRAMKESPVRMIELLRVGGIAALFKWLGQEVFRGPGHFTASNIEWVILATRGRFIEPAKKLEPQVIIEPLRDHSRKPYGVHEWFEQAYPDMAKVELFARPDKEVYPTAPHTRPGWLSLGNEVQKGVDLVDSIPRAIAGELLPVSMETVAKAESDVQLDMFDAGMFG